MPTAAVKVTSIRADREEAGMKMEHALREFLSSRKRDDCRPRTLENYDCDCRYFIEFMQQDKSYTHWNQVTRSDVRDYVDWVKGQKTWSVSTQRKRLRHLRAFFNWVDQDEDCGDLGMRGFAKQLGKIGNSEMKKNIPTVLDVRKFLSSFNLSTRAGLRNYTMVVLFADTGARSGELRHIKIDEHLFLDENLILIPEDGKTGTRPVYIQEETATDIRRWIRKRKAFCEVPYLFCDNKGTSQVSEALLPHAFRMARMRSGVANVTAHMLRHFMVTTWLKRNGAVDKLMQMTGHKRMESLQRYIHLRGDQSVAEEQRRVNPLQGIKPDHRTGRKRTQIKPNKEELS